jgi:hypothetical protein
MEVGMITMTNIICAYCGKKLEKKLSEINRQKKRGKKIFYCNRICAGKNNVQHLHKYAGKFNNNLIPNNRSDQYTEFRWYIKNVIKNSKKKNQGYDIDLKYLKDLWEQQGGICPFTKEKLELRTHTTKNKSHPYSASLDRIDNSKGYIKGNVRFVSLIFNYARNTFSDDTVIEFCKKITASNHTG